MPFPLGNSRSSCAGQWRLLSALYAGVLVATTLWSCNAPPQQGPDTEGAVKPPPSSADPKSGVKGRTGKRRGSQSLSRALTKLRQTPATQYLPPTSATAEAYRQYVRHLGNAVRNHLLPSQPANSGFTGSLLNFGRIWLLAESSGTNTGGGALALRAHARTQLIIEAPHTFFDTKTLSLAVAAFEETKAQALLINTVHRGGLGSDKRRIDHIRRGKTDSDAAHNDQSFFHQAHLELIRLWPQASVIQLHGYRDEKVPRAKIIVSAAGGSAAIAPLARALNDALGPGTAALYPSEVAELGGTTNKQAAASRKEGSAFIHLELASSLRMRLARQPALRKRFTQALKKGIAVH